MDSSSMISTNHANKCANSFASSEYSSDQESGWSLYFQNSSNYASSEVDYEEFSVHSGYKTTGFIDHDLEDTASSSPPPPPPHSPQHSDDELNQFYMNANQKMDTRHIFKEYNLLNTSNQQEHEGIYFGTPQVKTDEMELVETERKWIELGRTGLCLVPMSMLYGVS